MTPEQWADRIDGYLDSRGNDGNVGGMVADAIRAAVAAEGEACARALESLDVEFDGSARSWSDGVAACRKQGAAAIRARCKP